MSKKLTIGLALVLVVGVLSQVAMAGLVDIGPVRLFNDVAPAGAPNDRIPNGFPIWYLGTNNVVLKPSFVGDGLLGPDNFLVPTTPNPAPLQNVPFGLEAFIWGATAVMTPGKDPGVPAGMKARNVLDLEMSYSNGFRVLNGDQYVFGRVRIDIDINGLATPLVPGTYTVTFPFGVKTYTLPDAKLGFAIKDTFDHGGLTPTFAPRIFDNIIDPFPPKQNLSPVGAPFLTQLAPPPPAGRLGDNITPSTITGSPFGTNFFRIDGPANAFGPGVSSVTQNLWTVSGKLFDGNAFKVIRATYSSKATVFVADIVANTPLTKTASLSVAGLKAADVPLLADGIGNYRVHAGFGGPVPATVMIKDLSPAGVAAFNTFMVRLIDVVFVSQATFTPPFLTINATSSDASVTTLKVTGNGIPAGTTIPVGVATNIRLAAPPATVLVSSAKFGAANVPVVVTP